MLAALPLPDPTRARVVVPAPGAGPGFWAGAPSAVSHEGAELLAYRERRGHDGIDATVVLRDGEEVVRIDERRFGAKGMERPALVPLDGGGWRLYVCGATPGSAHWWTGVLEAAELEGLAGAECRLVFPGDADHGVKDPVVRRRPDGTWEAWLCVHPLDVPGAEDRMTTAYATSHDGLAWTWHGTVLRGRPGRWDARGARLTCVLPDGRALYDGRASAEENWFERCGVAVPRGGALVPEGEPVLDGRYVQVLGDRVYYEARTPDGSHELRVIGG